MSLLEILCFKCNHGYEVIEDVVEVQREEMNTSILGPKVLSEGREVTSLM